jgi:HTH-type transcriptional regulator, competence development regulator
MTFGQFIRSRREARGMTVTALAEQIGVSLGYASRIERERENPPPDHLILRLATVLQLPTDELFARAQRLPPDMRPHAGDVIEIYRQQVGGRRPRRKPLVQPDLLEPGDPAAA